MHKSAIDMALLSTWVGKQESVHDRVTVAPARAMAALLNHPTAPVEGEELPALWHWLYFLAPSKQSELGSDGHAKRGGFLPPVPLPRRMWAGGSLVFEAPVCIGDSLTRTSTVQSVTSKTGRSGELVFVTVEHRLHRDKTLCLTETHDIVYRSAPSSLDLPLTPIAASSLVDNSPTAHAVWHSHLVPDDMLLFRYSALTFNAHRIHYDRQYATQTEGYPGLVVHGPLIASLLLDVLRQHSEKPLKRFTFKAVRPVFECADQRQLHFNAQMQASDSHCRLWAQDHEGWLAMQADAEFR
jgi:3-methylfumaryl-CoA hydratase